MNTVWVPRSVTEAETFLWYDATPDLKVGIAYLWKQKAFRFWGSYQLLRETASAPSFHVSAGLQGIGTGNPGYAARFEKNFRTEIGTVNAFAGLSFRTNEHHGHEVAGIKLQMPSGLAAGAQWEGHEAHPFVTYSFNRWIVGFYLIGGENPGYMAGVRF